MPNTKSIKTSFSSEENKENKIPKGATILSEDTITEVEQIENGYLLIKRKETKYSTKEGGTNWAYQTKKWYSKEDPVSFSIKNKELADMF